MTNGWFFSRLYVCLLVMALPLLPAGVSQPALSRSSSQLALSSDLTDGGRQAELGEEAATHGDLGLPPAFRQAGLVPVIVSTRSDAKRQRFTPWGGKRTLDDTAIWKRPKFQPWGGKRFARRAVAPRYANSRLSAFSDDSKREFHPWGGKRSI